MQVRGRGREGERYTRPCPGPPVLHILPPSLPHTHTPEQPLLALLFRLSGNDPPLRFTPPPGPCFRCSWYRLAISAEDEEVLPHVMDLLATQVRFSAHHVAHGSRGRPLFDAEVVQPT